jgi:hypothetical protein
MNIQNLIFSFIVGLFTYNLLEKNEPFMGGSGLLIWSENKRGNQNYKKKDKIYPPCYDICGASQKQYDILHKYNLTEKYKLFLDLQSILLCQEVHLQDKKCNDTMIDERIQELKNNVHKTKIGIDIISKYLSQQNSSIRLSDFLGYIVSNLELQKDLILNENQISQEDKNLLLSLLDTFYNVHIPIIIDSDC